MDPFGNYISGSSNQYYGYAQHPPQRKNSDLIREAQTTFNALPHKEAEDLREFINKNRDNIRTYDLTEENLKWLKHLRKYPFCYIVCIEWKC
jgi:hypothetical protein